MESTSTYWIPIGNILSVDLSLKLVNPYFIKQLPGKKGDVKDAEWITTVLMKGLIRGSYVPDDSVIQQLRLYERRAVELNKNKVHAGQHIDMVLQRCNIRISNYVFTTDCKGYQKVADALILGKCSTAELVKLIHNRTNNKWGKQVIEDSLEGFVHDSDRDMLEQYRDERNLLETHKARCLTRMEAICEEYYQQEIIQIVTLEKDT